MQVERDVRIVEVHRLMANAKPLAQDESSLCAYLRLKSLRNNRPNTIPPATSPAAIWGSKKRTKRAPASVISTTPAGTACTTPPAAPPPAEESVVLSARPPPAPRR